MPCPLLIFSQSDNLIQVVDTNSNTEWQTTVCKGMVYPGSAGQGLTLAPLWANSANNKLIIFSYFSQKIGFAISCKLSPEETICMKCQSLFWENQNTYFKMLSAEILSSILFMKGSCQFLAKECEQVLVNSSAPAKNLRTVQETFMYFSRIKFLNCT